jgi:serine/threonine protein kinase
MVLTEGQSLQNGKYVIEKIFGQAAFGTTCKVKHVHLGHTVVIKTPSEKNLDHFNQEVKILAQLSNTFHPNIVRVRDLFMEENLPCLVMDFVPGENLYQRVKAQGKFSEIETINCIHQIGDALIAVHEAGFIHRDVTPRNIIRQPNGQFILIDFGIALPDNSRGTDVGVTSVKEISPLEKKFTKEFAPYEQILGIDDDSIPAVDVYSLAATSYFILTGQTPVNSRDREVFDRPLITPKEYVVNISDSLESAIVWGMELKQDRRPQSIHNWVKVLPSLNLSSTNSSPKRQIFANSTSYSGVDYSQLKDLLSGRI